MALARYKVTGATSVRDAVTRQDVAPGGFVMLDDQPVKRHGAKPLAGTNIKVLISLGIVAPAPLDGKGKKDS